jgi:hypothetical protein
MEKQLPGVFRTGEGMRPCQSGLVGQPSAIEETSGN